MNKKHALRYNMFKKSK